MIADDLFAGAGGWDLAAASLGIHARGVENMPEARATREAAGLDTIHDDVWTYRPDGKATGLIASPPCQTFSAAGKGSGRKALDHVLSAIDVGFHEDLTNLRRFAEAVGDPRTGLVLTPLHFATQHDYEWLAWEQVPTVLPVWEACAEVLKAQGWSTWTGYLFSEQYGVPQTRKRAFLLASRTGEAAPPTPTHSRYHSRDPQRLDEGVLPWVSMARALGWADDAEMVSNYGTGGDAQNRGVRTGAQPAPTVTSKIDRNRVHTGQNSRVAGGGTQRYSKSVHAPAPTVTGQTRSWRVDRPDFIRMTKMPNSAQRPVDVPAPTIAFGHDSASCRWFFERPATTVQGDPRLPAPGHRCMTTDCHPDRKPESMMANAVRVTVEEAAVLQSFPADFPFNGGPKDSSGKKYLQVGNAVPPGMALHALAAAAGLAAETRVVA